MKNKLGFTLIEMLTSIAIIVMVTAVFTANYKNNNRRSDLVMMAQKMVADIHATQNNSLGLVKYGNIIPAAGWGVNFDITTEAGRSKYIIFADLDQPGYEESGATIPPGAGFMKLSEGEADVQSGARIIDLPSGIIIDSLNVEGTRVNSADITFLPPDPKTHIFSNETIHPSIEIRLKDTASGLIKAIRVNFLGLVEVTDSAEIID